MASINPIPQRNLTTRRIGGSIAISSGDLHSTTSTSLPIITDSGIFTDVVGSDTTVVSTSYALKVTTSVDDETVEIVRDEEVGVSSGDLGLPDWVGIGGGGGTTAVSAYPSIGTYTAGPITLAISGHNSVSTNLGAAPTEVQFLLPAASGGLRLGFTVESTGVLKVIADGTNTIRMSSAVTAAGGNIACSGLGGFTWLLGLGTNRWVAETVVGSWLVT